MDDSKDVQQLVDNPSLLVELCRQVIDRLAAASDSAAIASKKRELQDVIKAITSLERIGITPPEELFAKRDRISAALTPPEEIYQSLRYLVAEFKKILADLQAKLNPEESPARQPIRIRRSRSPRTRMEVFKENIIIALQKLGGKAEAVAVVEQVGKQLEGKLTPGDLEWSKSRNMYAWQHKTHWARYELTRDGVLRRNSPRGIWELSDQYR